MPGRLVLISGLPAAGKTTLAARLGRDLPAPVIHRDLLRRRVLFPIADALPETRDHIPEATNRMVVGMLEAIVDAGGLAVLDGNFNNPYHGAAVRDSLAERDVRCFEVCVWGDADELRRRFIARADPPLTPDLEPYFESVLVRERVPVLGPPTPAFHIDTTDLGALDHRYPSLLEEIRSTLGAEAPASR